MNCEVKELSMPDGNVNFVYHWIPVETESVVVLSHGMAEHAARYARFAEFLAKNKIALIAEDHRGHGKTGLKAQTDGTGMPGFLADKDGFNLVTEDIHEEILYAKKIFPGKKIFLLGHSFGSFISRHFPAFLSYLLIILIGLSTNPLSMIFLSSAILASISFSTQDTTLFGLCPLSHLWVLLTSLIASLMFSFDIR